MPNLAEIVQEGVKEGKFKYERETLDLTQVPYAVPKQKQQTEANISAQSLTFAPSDIILPVCTVLLLIIVSILFAKRKRTKKYTEKPKKEKTKKVHNTMKTKRILKNILMVLWLIYIIAQFCFFVPFKTFDPEYDFRHNLQYRYTGTIIKTLWYDEPYTQINFPLLLTQAGVVTVVLGTLYFAISKKEENISKETQMSTEEIMEILGLDKDGNPLQ